jgi:hypothetical protein
MDKQRVEALEVENKRLRDFLVMLSRFLGIYATSTPYGDGKVAELAMVVRNKIREVL